MGKLNVSVVYLTREKEKKGVKIIVNDDENIGLLLEKLIEKLSLPSDDEQGELEYALFSKEKNRALVKDESFLQQGVKDGEILIIKTKRRAVAAKEEKIVIEEKLTCPICKSEISDEDVFCSKCGQRLVSKNSAIEEKTEQEIHEEKQENGKPERKKSVAFLLAVIIIVLVFLSLAVGAALEKNGVINVFSYVSFQEKPTLTEAETTGKIETTTEEPTTIDENLIMVEVTIQSSFLDEASRPTETLSQEQLDRGYTDVKINADGSVTYKIRKPAWRKILEEFRQDMKKTVDDTAEAYDFIDSITYNEDFSQFRINVDSEKYKSNFDSAVCLSLYIGAGYYQMFDLKEPGCTFLIIDSQSGSTIDTFVYPNQIS